MIRNRGVARRLGFGAAGLLLAGAVRAAPDDPRHLMPPRPLLSAAQMPCGELPARPLTVPDLVDIALCRNPQTAASWANVRATAAGIGIARSADYPTVTATVGPTLNRTDYIASQGAVIGPNNQLLSGASANTEVDTTAQLALSWLLFDFGGRAARIAQADAQTAAALAGYADTAQAIALSVVTDWNSVQANRAAEAAAGVSVAFAQSSRDLAAARKTAGVATGADRLQAETSLAQAQLTLTQARGNTATSLAQLAVTIGLPPMTRLDLAAAPPLGTVALLRQDAARLIASAERLRPDIAQARANVAAAEANVRVARSNALPTVSLSASNTLSATDTTLQRNGASAGVTFSVPLFTGYNRRYAVTQARAQAEQQAALAEQTRQQAGLQVYTDYIAADTALKALDSARALVASASASADIAQGRYRAGVGNFTDLLNAQSALASARQQLVQAEFNLRTASAQLARAVGGIGDAIDEARR